MLLQRLQIGRHCPVHAHEAFSQSSLPALASSCLRRWGCASRSAQRRPCSHRGERSRRSARDSQSARSLVAAAATTVGSAEPASSAANEFAAWLQDLPWTKIATWATVFTAAFILIDFFGVSSAPRAHAYLWRPRCRRCSTCALPCWQRSRCGHRSLVHHTCDGCITADFSFRLWMHDSQCRPYPHASIVGSCACPMHRRRHARP